MGKDNNKRNRWNWENVKQGTPTVTASPASPNININCRSSDEDRDITCRVWTPPPDDIREGWRWSGIFSGGCRDLSKQFWCPVDCTKNSIFLLSFETQPKTFILQHIKTNYFRVWIQKFLFSAIIYPPDVKRLG